MLGLATLNSCALDKPEYETLTIDKSDILKNEFDKIMKNLGVLVKPYNSITEVKTFSFNSSEDEMFFFKIDSISDKEITVAMIKYDENLKREDSTLYLTINGTEIDVCQVNDGYQPIRYKYANENNKVTVYKEKDNIWVELSALEQNHNNSFMQTFTDGKTRIFYDIVNNCDFPEKIYFELPEDVEDEVVFE